MQYFREHWPVGLRFQISSSRIGKPLQAIAKLANIELTQNNPKHGGGRWHVESMANENIVATGIYYYHTENIIESRLDFRIQVKEPHYCQFDTIYGLWEEGPLVHYLDGIMTKKNRCIVFPSTRSTRSSSKTQHCPDEEDVGVLFGHPRRGSRCVDGVVSPQQADWCPLTEVLQEIEPKLPLEIEQMIARLLDRSRLMRLEEAKRHREEMMKEGV